MQREWLAKAYHTGSGLTKIPVPISACCPQLPCQNRKNRMSEQELQSLAIRLSAVLQQSAGSDSEEEASTGTLAADVMQLINGWAVGAWKVAGDQLLQLSFAADKQFDAQVAADFVEATRKVPLAETTLGIVNAVVNRRSAWARSTELEGDLRRSAGWLGRFEAACSLSCPLTDAQGVPVGVLAVSWKELVDGTDPRYQTLEHLAAAVSERIGN